MARYREYLATKYDYYARNPQLLPPPSRRISSVPAGDLYEGRRALRSSWFHQKKKLAKKAPAWRRLDG